MMQCELFEIGRIGKIGKISKRGKIIKQWEFYEQESVL
jgi:hypothetical protein